MTGELKTIVLETGMNSTTTINIYPNSERVDVVEITNEPTEWKQFLKSLDKRISQTEREERELHSYEFNHEQARTYTEMVYKKGLCRDRLNLLNEIRAEFVSYL